MLIRNLDILREELRPIDRHRYVVRVFDNDDSLTEPERFLYQAEMHFEYTRHERNIGSDANIALCYGQENAEYILALGDDDFLLPGRLRRVMALLEYEHPDVLFIRASGFEYDYVREVPKLREGVRHFRNPCEFLRHTGAAAMAISCLVLRRSLYDRQTPAQYLGTNLIQLGVLLDAMENATRFAATTEYIISGKRNNTGGYDPESVFVSNVHAVYRSKERRPEVAASEGTLFAEMLKRFFPQRLFQARLAGRFDTDRRMLYHREFSSYRSYWCMVVPILWMPRALLPLVGVPMVIVSKLLSGDIQRVFLFLRTWVRAAFHTSVAAPS